jgi:hypothetical protein
MNIRRHKHAVAIVHNDEHLVGIWVSASLVDTYEIEFARQVRAYNKLHYLLAVWTVVAVIKYILF